MLAPLQSYSCSTVVLAAHLVAHPAHWASDRVDRGSFADTALNAYHLYSMLYALCSMLHALCTMRYALRAMRYALCAMRYALRATRYVRYALCAMRYALRAKL